jgi:CubicO group peptidase (beta-lactamase class C family)
MKKTLHPGWITCLPLFIALLIHFPTRSQTLPAKLDTLLTAYARQHSFNGSALVARQDTVLLEKGYGYKNIAAHTPHDSNGIFQIGSITKQFTSAIILQLEEKKKLSLQDKLSRYIPDYPRGNEITIENLLTHTSGIYNYTNDGDFMKNKTTRPINRDSLIARFKNKPLDFTPGEKFNYSNSGYILLGYIIEKVTGKPYFRVVRENIFQPLHMRHSGFNFTGLSGPDKAIGYASLSTDQPADIVDSSVSFAAGAIYTTTGDLYKWDRALYTGRIISQASLQKAFTPYKSHYGYGWGIDSAYGKKIVQHGGGITGFVSFILRVPEDGTCIILLSNQPTPALGKIAADINAVLNGKEVTLPKDRKEITLDTAILQQYVGGYELAPGFVITITVEDGKLISQATGQGKAELFAEKENFFFLKIVDAQIEFIKGADGKIEKLVLYQNGRQIPGKKIK